MDITMLYAIGIAILVLGFAFLFNYLRKKNIITANVDDLITIATTFNLTVDIINSLNLKYEANVKQITGILGDTLDFAIKNYDDKRDMEKIALDYAIGLSEKVGLEMTDKRKEVMKKLIETCL